MLYFIFWITDHIHRLSWRIAAQIGLVVALIICIIAPFTQCGINPARDLGPRIIAYFNGYGINAITQPFHASISVYVIGPFIGATVAAMVWSRGRPALH
jgi:glycerol uptake facilitator protein